MVVLLVCETWLFCRTFAETMPALIEVDSATERLRDGSLAVLAAVYILPLAWVLPPSVNVALTASLTVFSACLRTVGRTNEAELVSKKVWQLDCVPLQSCVRIHSGCDCFPSTMLDQHPLPAADISYRTARTYRYAYQ